jgi:hypothetical protein
MISLFQRQGLLAGFLLLSLLAPISSSAYARGGGGSGGHAGGFSGGVHGGFSAGGSPIGMPSVVPRASLGSAPALPLAGGGSAVRSGATASPAQIGQGDHHHHRPPARSGGSGSGALGAANAFDQSTMTVPTQTQVPSPPVNTGRNPALTGGTDPAIGQPSPPVPDIFASSGGSATIDHSGGGQNTLASCMSFWDSATHMSRAEWRQTCNRTLNGIDLPVEMGGAPAPTRSAEMRPTSARHASVRETRHARGPQ